MKDITKVAAMYAARVGGDAYPHVRRYLGVFGLRFCITVITPAGKKRHFWGDWMSEWE